MRKKLCCIMSVVLALSICMPGGSMRALAADGGGQASTSATAPQGPAASEQESEGAALDQQGTVDTEATVAEGEGTGVTTGEQEQAAPATDEQAILGEESEANATRAGPEEVQENPAETVMRAPLRAPTAPKQVTATVTDLEIQKPQGTPITEIGVSEGFYLAMDWKVDDPNDILHAGDYFDITLPDEMNFAPAWTQPDFDIKDANGAVVAHGHVTPGDGNVGGTVRVTFNDAIENNYNVHGTIYLHSVFHSDKINNNQTNTFTVSVQGKPASTEVTVNKVSLSDDEVLTKWGEKGGSDGGEVSWWVRINYKKADLQNTVITDSLTEGNGSEEYIPGSFSLRRVELTDTGAIAQTYETIDVNDRVTFGPDNRSFTLDLGDLGTSQYYLIYHTTYDAASGATLRNNLKLESSDGTNEISTTYHLQGSGGTAGGDLASKIKIVKVDAEDGSVALKDAVFEVTRPDGSTFELTTGADGTVTSGVLTQGTYTVREKTAPAGYELNGEEFTLEVTPAGGALKTVADRPIETSVKVDKKWVGPEGGPVTVRLLADGADTGKTLTLTKDGGWTGSFDGLRKYDAADGHEVVYSVTEAEVSGVDASHYTTAVSGDAASGFTITNTNAETVSVPVSKSWVGPKGSAVTVKLLADGAEVPGKSVTLDEGNGWSSSFDGLPKYDAADGHEVVYSVTEAEVSGVDASHYTTAVSGDAASGFTITNTNAETVTIEGAKTWDDDGDRDGVRPESITIRLLADGSEVDSRTVTADGGWAYSFDGLAKYDPTDGHEVLYTVTEDAVPNYATAISGTDITNSYTPGRTSVTVTKAWDDANDQDGIRTGSVMVQLYANGEPTGDAVELSADNQWTHTWTDLFQRDGGKDVAYTVEETEVPEGYTATVSGDATVGFTVTNAHEPETISVPVTKRWVGPEGGPVTIRLLADGIDTGKTLTLSADNGWTGSFDDLAKNKDGRAVGYAVSEDPVEGYTSEVSGDAEHGFTVTNAEEPKVPKDHEPGRPAPRRSDHERLPQTGDEGTLPIAPLVVASLVAFSAAALARRRASATDGGAVTKGRHLSR